MRRWSDGDDGAFDEILPLVYGELRRIARGQRRRRPPGARGATIGGTTDLVHEAYLRFSKAEGQSYGHRDHFYAVAARAMRQILLDQAKRRQAQKRGAGVEHQVLDPEDARLDQQAELMLALDQSLERLGKVSPRAGRVVEYRFFGGLTEQETARVMGVDGRTVRRDWAKARAWLAATLGPSDLGVAGGDPLPDGV